MQVAAYRRRLCPVFFLAVTALSASAFAGPVFNEDGPSSPRAKAARRLTEGVHLGSGAEPARTTHAEDGSLRFLGAPPSGSLSPPGTTPEAAARRFMMERATAFGLDSPATALETTRATVTGLRTSVRMRQTYGGLPVFGAEAIVQVHRKRGIESAVSDVMRNTAGLDTGKIPLTPAVDAAEAVSRAEQLVVRGAPGVATVVVEGPELLIFAPEVLGLGGVNRLAWSMVRAGVDAPWVKERVFVDARTGEVFLHFSLIQEALAREVHDAANSTSDPGNLVRTEGEPATSDPNNTRTNGVAVPDADDAYDFFGDTYDFYWNEHGRDSIDGNGMVISGTVRFCPGSPSPCPMANAFWNGARMYFGEGFAGADDVVGHELTHGVTQHTSSLIYFGLSGAMNESFSDIWGEFIDLTNGAGNDAAGVRWLMGEDLPNGAIRDMKNPVNSGQPDSTCSPYWWEVGSDNGGVHINSGVPNKLCYLLTDGASFRGYTISGMGISLVADLFYECQVNLLTQAADFVDLYNALTQAAINLGLSAAQRANIANACKAVAITPETSCQPPPDNNDCENAMDIVADRYYTGSTVTATGVGHVTCNNMDLEDYRDVWFRFTPITTESHIISACGSDFDTTLSVFSGTCGNLTSLGCNDDTCSVQSEVILDLTAGTPYLVRLAGFGSAVGAYSLRISTASGDGACEKVLLHEDFSNGIPPTWTLIDNDGRTPVLQDFTAAWIAMTGLESDTDTEAVSTSWYNPVGAADDWLITPAITLDAGSTLQWDAAALDPTFSDGYEVRISAAGPGMSAFLANAPLFTTPSENAVWTTREVDLAAAGYANQAVHIAFRNNSYDDFLLMIDNVGVCGTFAADNDINVSPTYYLFPNRVAGAGPTASVAFTIGNAGPDDLRITSVGLTGDAAVDYAITGDTGETTLAAGTTRTVQVAFNPLTPGDKVAYVTVESNDPADPSVGIYLWGVAEGAPNIVLSPTSLDFGYQSVTAGPTASQSVSIGNTGESTLNIASVHITGANAADFAIAGDTGETALAVGASRTVTLQFNPAAEGNKTAALSVASDDPDDSPASVILTGNGVDPAAGFTDPLWVDFAHGGPEEGSETSPFNTLAEGTDFVTPAGTVYVKSGNTAEALRITKPMRLEAPSGTVRAGALP